MSSNRPSADYLFHVRGRKEQLGPTFLQFVSPTPLNRSVSALPTVTREFWNTSSVPVVKPEPDVEALLTLSQSALHSSASMVVPRTIISGTQTAQCSAYVPGTSPASREETSATSEKGTTPLPDRTGSFYHAVKATNAGLRASSVSRFKLPSGIPPSASRAPARATPARSEGFRLPPDLPPSASRVTRSASAARASLSGVKSPSSTDLSATGVTLAEPADPNDYVRLKKSCQLTIDEKQRRRKGKNAAPDQLFTAWFEKEGDYPLRYPPDLFGHSEIEYGDIFWYRSSFGVQMWIWMEGENDSPHGWRPVSLGAYRSVDGRYLGLNPSQRPSWMTRGWFGKKRKCTVRVFIFEY